MRVPLYIEFSGRKVLVVGGGNVGTRRAKKFLEAGARVRVVSLEFTDELKELSAGGRIELVREPASPDNIGRHLEWADLVVLATSNLELNREISKMAKAMGKLVNNATDAEDTDVVVPFEVEVEGLRVAITTEGKAGVAASAAAKKIRRLLEEDREIIGMLKVFTEVKKYMKKRIPDPKTRFPLYFRLAGDERIRRLIREGRLDEAYREAVRIVDETAEK